MTSANESSDVTYYTAAEVAKNTGKGGTACWMIYKDIVYDFTKYLDEHPGGPELVLEYGGKDGTHAVHAAGHTKSAIKMFDKYKIGELHMNDRKAATESKSATTPKQAPRSCMSIVTCGIMK